MRKYNIPIFVPHKGCPFDCVFCNQNRITGSIKETAPDDVTRIIDEHLSTIPCEGSSVEAAFFGGSFTGIPIDEQSALMERVQPYIRNGRVSGIRLSTRPDYIDDKILDNLKRFGVTTIELGVQSMNDEVLRASNRGHTSEQVVRAAELIRSRGFSLGLQMMTGLPGDTDERSVYTAERIAALEPDCVRIYPTLTIRDTCLEAMYRRGSYTPQTLEEAVELCKRLLLMFETKGINVIRVGLQPTDEINSDASVVAGPFHSAFRELVESSIYYDIMAEKIGEAKKAEVFVNPREVSKAIGCRRANIERLQKEFGAAVTVKGDENLAKREVKVIAVKTT